MKYSIALLKVLTTLSSLVPLKYTGITQIKVFHHLHRNTQISNLKNNFCALHIAF